jgi:hypothetical protein
MAAIAAIGAGVSLIGGAVSANQANKAGKRAGRAAARAQQEIDRIKSERVPITNPYAGNSNLSSLATNLSDMVSNPFANMSVATQASEIQMEQADMALANSLDTLATTGASAGGATALAQAALQSKKGVAANIESQEVANDARRAQGEATLMQQKKSEAQRMQASDVAGKQFVYGETEKRETTAMNRVSNQIAALRGQEAQAQADQTAAITGGIGAIAGIAGGLGGKI